MKTAEAPTKVVLSDAAVSLVNEIWEHLILINGRDVTMDELRAATPMGELTMPEYEHRLRKKLLELKTAWQNGSPKEATNKVSYDSSEY